MTATPARVFELSRSKVSCLNCDGLAVWRVIGDKTENRSCSRCLGDVADDTPTDGFRPLTLVRIFPAGAA